MPILVTNDFPPAHGGIQRLMTRLASNLVEIGRPVIVVAPGVAGSEDIDASLAFPVVRYRVITQKFAGVLAMSIGLLRALVVSKERTTIASIWWPAGFAVALLPAMIRGRFIVLAHGSEILPRRGGLRRHAMRFVYGRADAVLANSSFTKQLLAKAGVHRNVRLFTLGVDPREVVRRVAARPTVLSVGRLSARKGFDRVLEAVAVLLVEFPDLLYEIVGEGAQRAELTQRVAELGLERHVEFRGALSDEQLWEAYSRAWCFALPVRNIDDDVEGFGIVYLEAAIAGLPSIGGLNSGAVDAIVDGETGILVDGENVGDIACAIRTLLSDRSLSASMGARAKARAVEYFTWKRTARDIVACLPR